ncbi:MAG: NAD(+) synthase [Desulfovibrio sp.]|nr:NAD(+) synthase [Desulfovibrio sp.]
MKLALLQCNVLPDNPCANAQKLAKFCQAACDADLCVAPAGALAGRPAHRDCAAPQEALAQLAAELPTGLPLLCGLTEQKLFLLKDGQISEVKTAFRIGAETIGVSGPDSRPDSGPDSRADIILQLRSWRYYPGALAEETAQLANRARAAQAFACAVNLCGGYGGEIYGGQSLGLDQSGRLIARGAAFQEEVVRLDTAAPANSAVAPLCASLEQEQWLALRLGLADFVRKAGARQVLLGLSGGMDSALVAAIACAALDAKNVTGILMPSVYTSAQSLTDAQDLAANLGMRIFTVPIEPMLAAFRQGLAQPFERLQAVPADLTAENLQARIRGVILMAFANRTGALVLNTGNKSEAAMGYSTLYGDTVGAVAVIGDLFKTEVYRLARWHNEQAGREIIPAAIFTKPPSAELRPNQKDTDSLPPYDALDPELGRLLACAGNGDASLAARVRSAAFKRRQSPPPLLVSRFPLSGLC